MSDLVSIIIPNYNREFLITETLDSVLEQSYRPLEVIVIDDGSTDDSKRVVEEFASTHSSSDFKVILTRNQKKGAPAARNYGVEISNGEYIQFLDSDDLLKSFKISTEVDLLMQHEDLDYVYSKCQFFDAEGLKDEFWGREIDGSDNDYFDFSWQTMCPIFRRSAMTKIGPWNEELKMNQDWEYSIRAILNGARAEFIPEVHSLIRMHDSDSIGKNISPEKVRGKKIATELIESRLNEMGLMTESLRARYRKRWVFLVAYAGSFGYMDLKNEILSEQSEQFSPTQKLLLKANVKPLFKLMLFANSTLGKVKRLIT